MKKTIVTLIIAALMIPVISSFAQDKGYKDGSVWAVTFVKTNTGMGDDYIKDLKSTWKMIQDDAIKQNLIVSYKILQGMPANPEDWDMMLLVEYKNLAAMESNEDKWNALFKSRVGDDAAMKKLQETRKNTRVIWGEKVMREVVYQ